MKSETLEPFVIEPDALYPVDWLRERLHGIVELPTFLDRLGLRDKRVFRDAVFGWEVIEASRRAIPFNEAGKVDQATVARMMAQHQTPRLVKGATSQSGAGRLTIRDLRSTTID